MEYISSTGTLKHRNSVDSDVLLSNKQNFVEKEITNLEGMSMEDSKICTTHLQKKIKLSNMLMLIATTEDLPQLTLQLSIWINSPGKYIVNSCHHHRNRQFHP